MPRGPRLPRGAPSSRHANADGHLRRTHRYLPGRVVNERGSVTAFVVIMTSALLAMAGLVIDGGYALAAHRRAFNEAEAAARRSEEHTSELQSLMRISYAVFCLKKKTNKTSRTNNTQ